MHNMMQKLMDKKKEEGKGLSDVAKKAKIGVVESLKKMAEDAMKEKGLKKVSVASDSSEGLKHGLDMAKDKVEDMSQGHEDIVSPDEEDEMLDDAEYGKAHGADMLSGGGHGMAGDDRLQSTMDDDSDEEEASEDMDEDELDRKLAELMDKKKKLSAKKI